MDARQLERLTRIFASILVPVAATGCGNRIDEDQFTERLCGPNGTMILDAVEPAEPVDYLELRHAENYGVDGEPNWNVYVQESSGTLCGGAGEYVDACMRSFEELPLDSEFVSFGSEVMGHRSVAFTRGDRVGAALGPASLRELLGPVDAPGDAALFATLTLDQSMVCGSDNQVGEDGDGYVVYIKSGGGCGEGNDIKHHVVRVGPDGTVEIIQTEVVEKGDPNCSIGRLPAGLCRRPRARAADPVGAFFAEVAHLEAASVPAFGQLAREISRHGAPSSMVQAALRSRADEIRHARVTARLARRYGGRPVAPRVAAVAPRPLLDVARDNAAEGCIRETYGALVAHAQARRARDPQVRRALAQIARDETRHAALSWSFDGWARARMSAAERRRLDRDQAHAWQRLQLELTAEHHPRVHAEAGMPQPDQALAMFRRLHGALRA